MIIRDAKNFLVYVLFNFLVQCTTLCFIFSLNRKQPGDKLGTTSPLHVSKRRKSEKTRQNNPKKKA